MIESFEPGDSVKHFCQDQLQNMVDEVLPHVCVITDRFHRPWTEGHVNNLRTLLLSLKSQIKVSVITTTIDGSSSEMEGVYYIRPPKILYNVRKEKYLNSLFNDFIIDNLFDHIRILRTALALNKSEEIDLFHIDYGIRQGLCSYLLKKAINKPIVAAVYEPPTLLWISRKFEVSIFRSSKVVDRFLCLTLPVRGHLIKNGIPLKKIRIVPPFIDCERFKPLPKKEVQKKYMIRDDDFVVAYVGRIEPARGIFTLLKAVTKHLKENSNFKLIISSPLEAFEKKYLSVLIDTINREGLTSSIRLLGPSNQVEELYNIADIVAIPFTSKAMDPPISMLEAMACGKIVVVSNLGTISDIVENGKNGFLVTPGNVRELSKTITTLMEKSDELIEVRKNARTTILKRFSKDLVIDKLIDVYNELINESVHSSILKS